MNLSHGLSATPKLNGAGSSLADWAEELADRIQAGERVVLSDLARDFPERAEELRRLLPAIELMAEFGRSAATSPGAGAGVEVDPGPSMEQEPEVLGDFRLIREVGRGGMGVVFEAQQISLRRRVALKILPFAGAMDPRQLQRFQLEAQAAACLHHTNIVPVHAVGTERGVPFYAMQFIEGRSLAEVIAELRRLDGLDCEAVPAPRPAGGPGMISDDSLTSAAVASLVSGRPATSGAAPDPNSPTVDHSPEGTEPAAPSSDGEARSTTPPSKAGRLSSSGSSTCNRAYIRNVAGLGLQAAEALDHAHDRGILHRDIKPANLMLDAAGHLWVTDFGLAQIRGDSRLTPTGDILGTLRYMSPEQATARRVVVDGRTDIYSLGVTLYELLTLRPAIDGRDRAEILRRVVHEDPTPLRKINPAMPRDLETIVEKAMAKEPESRYGTARELADDLRRFLDDRQIAARRPSVGERTLRWMRRHPSVAAATAIVLVLAMLGSGVSTFLIAREQKLTVGALAQADGALAQAERRLEEKEAVLAYFNKLLYQASPFSPEGGTLTVKDLLEKAERELDDHFGDQPLVKASILHVVGHARQQNSQFKEAEPLLARALQLRRTHLGDDDPETLKTRLLYAYFAFAKLDLKDKAKGIPEFRDVLDIQRRILGPEDPDVIETTWRLADVLLFVDRNEAVRLAEQTVETSRRVRGPDDEFTRGFLRLLVDKSIELQGDLGRERKIEMLEDWYRGQKKALGHLSASTLAVRSELGWERWARGDLQNALRDFQQARGENWRDSKAGNSMWFACDAIPGLLLRYRGEHRAAAAEIEALLEKWTRIKGQQHDYVLLTRGIQALDRGELETARRCLSDLWRRVDKLPVPMCTLDTGKTYAESLAWSGDSNGAIEVARVVLADAERKKNGGEEYTEKHYLVAVSRDLMAVMLANPPKTSPAFNVSKAIELAATNVAYFPRDGLFRTSLGIIQYRAGLWDKAIATLTEANRLDEDRRFAPRGFVLAMAYWRNGEKEKAHRWFDRSAAWMDEHRPGHPEPGRARVEAANVLGLANSLADEGFPPDPFTR